MIQRLDTLWVAVSVKFTGEASGAICQTQMPASQVESRSNAGQVFLLIVIDGNFDEKSLFFAAIDTATWRATAL